MNTCINCQQTFENWVEYNEHMALSHWRSEVMSQNPFEEEMTHQTANAFATAQGTGRTDLAKQVYKPMLKAVKDRIVRQGEIRLGLKHFFGVLLLSLLFVSSVKADDDDKSGKQGPQGIQGVSGANGQDLTTQTQYGGEIAVRLYDHKYFQLQVFDALFTEHNLFVGGRILLKIGKSYEETLIEQLNQKIAELNRIKE